MKDYKPIPKCPYCGWEMKHLFDYPMNYCDVRFYCKHCNAMSPSARGCQTNVKSVEEALEEAYEKAMRRYEEPNRVLSLAELAVSAGTLVWIEDNNGDDEPCVCARTVTYWEPKSNRIYFDGGRAWYADCTYSETWRCWLREPTPEEMANTPWEEKQK